MHFLKCSSILLGECNDTAVEFGSLVKNEICAFLSGLQDKFFTHLALIGSGADVDGNVDGKLFNAAVAVNGVVVGVDVLILDGIWIEQPLELVYMYLPTLVLLLLSF